MLSFCSSDFLLFIYRAARKKHWVDFWKIYQNRRSSRDENKSVATRCGGVLRVNHAFEGPEARRRWPVLQFWIKLAHCQVPFIDCAKFRARACPPASPVFVSWLFDARVNSRIEFHCEIHHAHTYVYSHCQISYMYIFYFVPFSRIDFLIFLFFCTINFSLIDFGLIIGSWIHFPRFVEKHLTHVGK